MDWIKGRDWREMVVAGVVDSLVAAILATIVRVWVDDRQTRDIGIVIIAAGAVVVMGFLLDRSFTRRSPETAARAPVNGDWKARAEQLSAALQQETANTSEERTARWKVEEELRRLNAEIEPLRENATSLATRLAEMVAEDERRRREAEGYAAPRPYDDKIIQWVNAWLEPAWDKAIPYLLELRDEQKRIAEPVHQYQALLLQEAVIEPAARARGDVQKWIRHDTDAPLESLDTLAAAMYRQYERMVAHIWQAGAAFGVTWWHKPRQLEEWQEIDKGTLDRLRELTAAPEFGDSELRPACREVIEGGAGKLYRDRILGRGP